VNHATYQGIDLHAEFWMLFSLRDMWSTYIDIILYAGTYGDHHCMQGLVNGVDHEVAGMCMLCAT